MIDKLYRIVCGTWLGAMIFFSGIIAPLIFKYLPHDEAAGLQNHLFPPYYILGSVCGFLLFGLDLLRGRKKLYWIALATALAVIGWSVMSPLIHDAYLGQDASIKWLHPLAIALNVIVMIAVLIVT